MKIITFLIALFCTTSAQACVHSIASTDTYIEVCAASDSCKKVFYDELDKVSIKKQEEQVQSVLQNFLAIKIPLSALEPVDSDKATNPDCENIHWSLEDGTITTDLQATHLTSQGCIIDSAVWNGSEFILTIRRADRCQ